jgi:hypothetical protein
MSFFQFLGWLRWAGLALVAAASGTFVVLMVDPEVRVLAVTGGAAAWSLLVASLNPMRRWLLHFVRARKEGVDTREAPYRAGLRIARRVQAEQRRMFLSVGLANARIERRRDASSGTVTERVKYDFPRVLDTFAVTPTGVTLAIVPLTRAGTGRLA